MTTASPPDNLAMLAAQVLVKLEKLGSSERRDFAATSHPTTLRVLGVTVPALREVLKELVGTLTGASADQVVHLAKHLIGTGVLECQQVAYEMLDRINEAAASLDQDDIEELGRGLDNWLSVDMFAGLVAGPAWREGRLPDHLIHDWAHSEDRWLRRAAVVCTVALNQKARGGAGDAPRALSVCRIVAADHDDKVAKSLSWALRELAKRDPAPVVQFLAEHDNVLTARVKREVRRKLETGRK